MDPPVQPPPITLLQAFGYAILIPVALTLLLFVPAGTIHWTTGWVFFAEVLISGLLACLAIWRFNPIIFRARSRFQQGTKEWDLFLLSLMLPLMVAIIPVAALDVARFHWSNMPMWIIVSGHIAYWISVSLMTWAQAVNQFFEPGVRIQTERNHYVIQSGPYQLVRHPGYTSAILLFVSMALMLGSYWALTPALAAAAILVVRTYREDTLLHFELQGYSDYQASVQWKLLPGIW